MIDEIEKKIDDDVDHHELDSNAQKDNNDSYNNNDKKISLSKYTLVGLLIVVVLISSLFGSLFGFIAGNSGSNIFSQFFKKNIKKQENITDEGNIEKISNEDTSITNIAEKSSPAVVSIIISKEVANIQRGNPFFGFPFDPFGGSSASEQGTQKKEVGGGTGFFVSSDGMIVTNKHVVSDTTADYTVMTTDGKEYPAKVLARDPSQDIALVKIDGSNFPTLELGDSNSLKIGQTVVAIGNSLGEFSNTVSRGIISGLKRNLTAGSSFSGQQERLTNIIQTDAAINPGNSGGPLIDISGKVIGVNVAMAQGAQNIGFALPVNQVSKIISQVSSTGKISTPFLGVRYIPVDSALKAENNLPFDYGVLIQRGQKITDLAVIPGSPADKAGIMENDIILEINGEKISENNQLSDLVAKNNVGDTITAKVWHKGETKDVKIVLQERSQ